MGDVVRLRRDELEAEADNALSALLPSVASHVLTTGSSEEPVWAKLFVVSGHGADRSTLMRYRLLDRVTFDRGGLA